MKRSVSILLTVCLILSVLTNSALAVDVAGDSKNGPINGLEPSVKLPTHHGPDVQSIMPWLNINTMAVLKLLFKNIGNVFFGCNNNSVCI